MLPAIARTRIPCRFRLLLQWAGLTVIGAGSVVRPAGAAAADLPAANPSSLAACEVAGIMGGPDAVRVCVVVPGARRGLWLSLGQPANGWLADDYDAARAAVRLRVGAVARWVPLRGASIVPLPLVHLDDGSIDYGHMQLTDREKELKAARQMWVMLEVSRLGREDGPINPRTGRSSDRAPAPSSQPR